MRPFTYILRALPLAGAGLLLLARGGTTIHAATQASAPAEAPKFVTYKCGAAQWLNAPHTAEMSQGVTFVQDDATLETEDAVALLDNGQNLVSAEAHSPVHIFDPQDDLKGLHGSIDFTRHLAQLQDSVVLVVKPGTRETQAGKTSLKKQFKDPATLTCQIMTYDYRRKIGRVPGALTVRQVIQTQDGLMTRTLTADAGLYNGMAQTVQLVGDIKAEYSDGSHIIADTRPTGKPVVIGLKEGEEYIKIPFPTRGTSRLKPEPDAGKSTPQDNTGDVDLTVPPAPPSTKKTPPVAPAQTPAPNAPALEQPAAPPAAVPTPSSPPAVPAEPAKP